MTKTKLQSDYAAHDAYDIDEGWRAVRDYAENAVLIAFDTCHKIYLVMDDKALDFWQENYLIVENASPSEMVSTVKKWYEESCPLKFVQAVWENEDDPNAGFVSLIDQGADDPRDEYEDDEDYDG